MLAAPLFVDTRLEEIHERLVAYYGRPPERDLWDPLKQFIYSLLSSRTRNEISQEVVRHLEDRFENWERLHDASIPEIEEAIQSPSPEVQDTPQDVP